MKKLFSTRVSENALTFGLALLRIGLGLAMMVNHGWSKLTNFNTGVNRAFDPFGVGKTAAFSMLVFAEFFCAAFIVIGLFTRLAAIPLVIAMSIALFMAHKGEFFGDGEMSGLFLVGFLSILILGPGKASVDRLIGK